MSSKKTNLKSLKSEKLCVVIVDFRQWSGTTVLRETDFHLGEEGRLPPKEVIKQLGQKNILDPKLLERFNTIKARAVRYLQEKGVNFLGGYAVPLELASEVLARLDGYVHEYETAKADFINRYDAMVEDWIRQNPSFAHELLAAKKSRAEVDSKIYARYSVVRIQPIEEESQIERFNADVDGLSERLLQMVAQTAGKLSLGTLKGSKTTPIRPVPTLRKISSKLKGLSFLDAGINPIVDMIEALLAKVPADGRIAGPLFWETQAVVSVLADVERMKAIADGRLSLELWRENFVPDEAKPKETLELVPEMQMSDGTVVDVPKEPLAESDLSLEAELKQFIRDRTGEATELRPLSTVEAQPSPISTEQDGALCVLQIEIEPPKPEVPAAAPQSSSFFF